MNRRDFLKASVLLPLAVLLAPTRSTITDEPDIILDLCRAMEAEANQLISDLSKAISELEPIVISGEYLKFDEAELIDKSDVLEIWDGS